MEGAFKIKRFKFVFLSALVLLLLTWHFLPKFESKFDQNEELQGIKISDLRNFPQLELGDLIMREGLGNDSLVIKQISDHFITHIGVIISLDPVRIIHASIEDDKDEVSVVSLDEFLSLAKSVVIKRLKLDADAKNGFLNTLNSRLTAKFKLSTQADRLYCTTLVMDALKPFVKLDINYSKLDFVVFSGEYLYPSSFYENNQSRLIFEFRKI